MITVFKYIIDPCCPEIHTPKGAKILKVEFQRDNLCMWMHVDSNQEVEARNFVAFATGQEIPQSIGVDYEYIGTSTTSTNLVCHAFERLGL